MLIIVFNILIVFKLLEKDLNKKREQSTFSTNDKLLLVKD